MRVEAQIITDTDYADDIALLANTPAQAESLQHSLEKAAGTIGLHVICFNQNQRGDICNLTSGSLKLVNRFTYLGSSVSPTEIDTRLAKACSTIDRLSVKSEVKPIL